MKLHRGLAVPGLVLVLALTAGCAGTSPAVPGTATRGGSAQSSSAGPTTALPAGQTKALGASLARGAAGLPATAGAALDAFGAGLLRQQAAENAVLSPYSIYAVLAMARAGAKGQTAAQLDAVLGGAAAAQAGNVTAVDQAVAAALVQGKAPTGDPTTTDTRPEAVDVANSVWLSPALPVHQDYLDSLSRDFGVGLYQVDYAADPEAARKAINRWVSQRTHALIPQLLATGTVDTTTVITLVNAMYLTAPWQTPFTVESSPLPFTTVGGTKVSASGMSVSGDLDAAQGSGWTSVTVPYRGGGLAMTILLPDVGQFAAVRGALATVLPAATSGSSRLVQLTMPKFKSSTSLSLAPAMEKLGVKDIFDPTAADISGISGPPHRIYATNLVHQAVITVDEKGTEAAAATAMTMSAGAAQPTEPPLDVTVDRPFFYVVHDTTTGAPLFLGQVTDPTK
ncbi:serpin B [Nakamurella panacisegetis]|uniref:Serpin B n=1 Tax=Nakamurella panacisegetis TaxID=1090615 RepID=A0A1H0T2R4_9ACTN|nr:serpin family protein [Nakamurella panacisegetis]SDP48071.1 serpin B [Nakamurella panacisegetis]